MIISHKNEIINLYDKFGQWKIVAQHFGISTNTLMSWRKKLDIKEIIGAGKYTHGGHLFLKKLTREKFLDYCKQYDDKEICNKFKVSLKFLNLLREKLNIEIKEIKTPRQIFLDKIESKKNLIQLYDQYHSWYKISKILKVSQSALYRYLKNNFDNLEHYKSQYYQYSNQYLKKRQCNNGYVMIPKRHPDNHKNHPIHEHRLVMEKTIKRELYKGECIHHIDGNKINNNIDNLFLCKSTKHHIKIEAQLNRIAKQLVKNKIILFDSKKGHYYFDGDSRD